MVNAVLVDCIGVVMEVIYMYKSYDNCPKICDIVRCRRKFAKVRVLNTLSGWIKHRMLTAGSGNGGCEDHDE